MSHSALVFQSTAFDVVDRSGQPWLRVQQIAVALGYKRADILQQVHAAHSEEFTDSMTAVVKLPTAGGEQDVRIFSLRGAHLLGMFARTAKAAEFRRWVLDILDRETQPASAPYAVNPTDTLTLEQANQLRDMLRTAADKMLSKEAGAFMVSGWSKLKTHFGVGYRQIPVHLFNDALAIISRHVADHAPALPAPTQLSQEAQQLLISKLRLHRHFISYSKDGSFTFHPIPDNASMMTDEEFIASIADPFQFRRELLPALITAAAKRLAA